MKQVFQIQFINPKWNGADYDIKDNFRTFKRYEDACNALDKISDEILSDLLRRTTSNVECHEERDENTELLSSIEFFTNSVTIDSITGDVVTLYIEEEIPQPQQNEPVEKTYCVEFWYTLYRAIKVIAKDEDEAYERAVSIPISPDSIDKLRLEDRSVTLI